MAQYAEDQKKKHEAELIRLVASIIVSISGVISMYLMNNLWPEAATVGMRIFITAPGLILIAIAIAILVLPADMEW